MAEASLNDIYQRLNGAERYHPMNASTHADWSLEAGDVVTVSRDGESYSAPVHSSTLQWNGKQKIDIESGGDRTRGPVAKMSARQYNTGNGGGNGCRGGRRQAEEDKKFGSILDKQNEYIYAEVYNRELADRQLSASIVIQKDRIDQTVKAVGKEGQITAASICLAINKDNTSEARIDADKVYIGNQKSTTIINGKLDAKDVTAEYLSAKIATIPTLTGISARFSGNVSATGAIMGSGVYIGSGTSYQSLSNAIQAVQIIPKGKNAYTLQQKRFSDTTWQNVSNFSTATTLTGAWSSGRFTVTASPQEQTFWTQLSQGTTSWSGNTATVPVNYYSTSHASGEAWSTGRSFTVDATARYKAGQATRPSDVAVKTSGITGTSLGTQTVTDRSYITFAVGDNKYYIYIRVNS